MVTCSWICCGIQVVVIERKSLNLCAGFLEEISNLAGSVILEICAEQCNLDDQV